MTGMVLIERFLSESNCGHILDDPRLDFNPHSVGNILKQFRRIDILIAEAISVSSRKQKFRDNIKEDLEKYFNTFNVYADPRT